MHELTELITTFFTAFRSNGPRMDALRAAFLPEALIVMTCGGATPTVYDVESFIAPREALLAPGGPLRDFAEWPEAGRLEVFGDIAHWFGSYRKSWQQEGAQQDGAGMKSLQFVRTAAGWRISAVTWDDERPGVALADHAAQAWPPHLR